MSFRSSIYGNGAPGGRVEYRGDLTPPVASYAASVRNSPMFSMLRLAQTPPAAKAAVVFRAPRRGGHRFFYSHGAVRMQNALPYPGASGVGSVNESEFQPYNVQLMDWQVNASWYESGYPRNLGWSTRVPQLQTNATGGPGKSSQDQRPLFTRVQTVPRAQATVRTYPTRGASA